MEFSDDETATHHRLDDGPVCRLLGSHSVDGAMMAFYVYAHFRADDGQLFYIGKGSGRRAWSRSSRNRHWKAVVNKHGRRVRILRSGLGEAEAFRLEAKLIAARRERLATYADGGPGATGYRHTEQTKKTMSEKRTGRKASAEARAAMSETIRSRADLIEMRAKRFSGDANPSRKPENRAAISERMRNSNPMSKPEVKAVVAAARLNRVCSPETRAKLSAALKGQKRGPMPSKVAEVLARVRETRKRPVATSCGLWFASTADAARATGARQGNIVNNCAGRANSAGGLHWRYADEN